MYKANRRAFLAEVGQGMMIATVGYGAALEMGLSRALADDVPARLSFGSREALVGLMQDTPADRLLPALVQQLKQGVTLKELVAAGALANARTFGGEDYVGFHTFMALAPAWHMAGQLSASHAALPVLKVLYRNTTRMQEKGGSHDEVLHPIAAAADSTSSEQLRQAVHDKDVRRAEQLLAAAAARSPEEAYNELLPVVAEGAEVHRTVLAYRVWDLLDFVGRDHALTLLRQSLHYCVENCSPQYNDQYAAIRALLPKLLDQYRLVEKAPGTRVAEDAWIESMSETIFAGPPERAADAVAAALAEGISDDSVAEAIALVTNQFVLRDAGRTEKQARPNKPVGSVHGDSIGVHASDSANAWRNIARASNRTNGVSSLIISAWQAARERAYLGGGDSVTARPLPHAEHTEPLRSHDQAALVRELNDAVRHQDQARACAAVAVYGEKDFAAQPVVDLLLGYGVSEDGALHAEKYYRTTTEEFGRSRPKFRWRQLVALARVTASEHGQPAPGMEEAKRLLGV